MRDPLPMSLQRNGQDRVFLLRQAGARHHHVIQTAELLLALPEVFAHDPLDAVAHHGGFGDLAGNRQTQARIG